MAKSDRYWEAHLDEIFPLMPLVGKGLKDWATAQVVLAVRDAFEDINVSFNMSDDNAILNMSLLGPECTEEPEGLFMQEINLFERLSRLYEDLDTAEQRLACAKFFEDLSKSLYEGLEK